MANRDTEVRPDTWTRAELLAERGYPEAIVNGHGRPDQETVSSRPEPANGSAPARSCAECGGPLAAGRQTTCGPECAAAARRRRDRERKRGRSKPAELEAVPTYVRDGGQIEELEAVPRPEGARARQVTDGHLEAVPRPSSNGDESPGPGSTPSPLELEAVTPAELVDVARPAELEAGAGGVSLADELEAAAGLLRRIAGRLIG